MKSLANSEAFSCILLTVPKQSTIMKKLSVFFLSFIISLIFVNVVLSFIYDEDHFTQLVLSDSFKAEKRARLFIADPTRIYKLADTQDNGNVYPLQTDNEIWNVDGLGFRPDHKPNDRKGEGTYIILMIGDSFTYGGEVAHLSSYPAILERKLLDSWRNVNVINAGVPGYGPDQQLMYLLELLPEIKPDLVIWNLYENDITDANYYCIFNERDGELLQLPSWKNNVYRQGYFVNVFPWLVVRQPISKIVAHAVGFPIGGDGTLPIATAGCTQKVTPQRLEELGKKVNIILHRASDAAKAGDAQIEFVLMPTQQSFLGQDGDPSELEKVELIYQLPIFDDTPLLDLTDHFNQLSEAEGKDVFHELYLSAKEEPGAFSRHLNPAGNEYAAQQVIEYLLQQDYFPKD